MHRHTIELAPAGRNDWPAWNVPRPKRPAGDVRPQQSRSEEFSIGRNHPAATEAQLKEILLSTTGRVRRSIASAGTAMFFAVTGGVLIGAAVLVAFLLRPPLLGWVGFAVVCAIVIGLATCAAIAFPRLRVSPQQPAAVSDADARLDSYWLEQDLLARAQALTTLEVRHVVVPPATTRQRSGTPPAETEDLRRARLSVWEYEGGGLGLPRPPRGQRADVVFDGVTILTAPGIVMTPRHTTEALVDWAVEWIGSRSVRVADVGTGSGAVAVAVALRAESARVWATDDSEAAVELARENVARFDLQERVEVLVGNLLDRVPGRLDLVLANLPYYAAAQLRGPAASACREEPEHAIYAPGDGLQFNRDLITACRTRLAIGGALAIQLYGEVLSAGRGELDQLLHEIEARAAEGWRARVAADSSGEGHQWSAWQSSPV